MSDSQRFRDGTVDEKKVATTLDKHHFDGVKEALQQYIEANDPYEPGAHKARGAHRALKFLEKLHPYDWSAIVHKMPELDAAVIAIRSNPDYD